MSSYVGNDPFESAANATLEPRSYFGQAQVIAGFCVLQKGIGRVQFDPQSHKIEDRRTELKIEIVPLAEHNARFPVLREMIAESTEFAGTVLPSLKKLGLEPRTLNNAWVQVKLVPTGRKYTNQAGEEKEATTFQFVAVYPNEDACRSAFHNGATAQAQPTQPAGNGNGNGSDQERQAAAKFLEIIVKQAKGDPTVVAERIAAMPMLAKFYTVDAPEVVALIQAVTA